MYKLRTKKTGRVDANSVRAFKYFSIIVNFIYF